MQLVEQHLIRTTTNLRYDCIDQAAFASKDLYNQVTCQIRQAFFQDGIFLSYAAVCHWVKHFECYQPLPRNVSNSILIQIEQNWKVFRKGLQTWREHPEHFTGKPKLPGYNPKDKGRFLLIYDKQALGKRAFKKIGKLVPSGLTIQIETAVIWESLDQVRIVSCADGYVIEVVYQQVATPAHVDPTLIAALDLGVDILVACTSTKPGFQPVLITARPLKSINQFYNKRRAHLQRQLAHANRFTSRRLDQITACRRIDRRLKEIILETIETWGQECIEMEVMSDHVHLLVGCDPQFGIHRLVKSIKGTSSRYLRAAFPPLKRKLPLLNQVRKHSHLK